MSSDSSNTGPHRTLSASQRSSKHPVKEMAPHTVVKTATVEVAAPGMAAVEVVAAHPTRKGQKVRLVGWNPKISNNATAAKLEERSNGMFVSRSRSYQLSGEKWEGRPEAFAIPPDWETIDAKLRKELKKIVKDLTKATETATLEENTLHKYQRQLSGMAIYIIIYCNFKRDEDLAKPHAFEELQAVVFEPSSNRFISKWDAARERFVSEGG